MKAVKDKKKKELPKEYGKKIEDYLSEKKNYSKKAEKICRELKIPEEYKNNVAGKIAWFRRVISRKTAPTEEKKSGNKLPKEYDKKLRTYLDEKENCLKKAEQICRELEIPGEYKMNVAGITARHRKLINVSENKVSSSPEGIDPHLKEIRNGLLLLASKMDAAEEQYASVLNNVHPSQKSGAINLLHYMALRNVDIRDLQDNLHIHGLSSLASSESHVRWQLNAVLRRIGVTPPPTAHEINDYFSALKKRHQRASTLFGSKENTDIPSIMVTFDTDLAEDLAMVKNLLRSGMNIARINCAHDDESVWQAMIWNIQKAVKTTGIPCKVYMDLAGPKMRTVIKGEEGKKHKLRLNNKPHFILSGEDDETEKENVVYCSEKGIVEQLHEGERILFDDGAVETVIEKVDGKKAWLHVIRASGKKPSIKEGKGINFPDSKLSIASLTKFDLQCLPFVIKNADLVGFSFVREASNVHDLQQKMKELTNDPPYIILKIETVDAVNNLPSLLLQGMKDEFFGVMVARGDLAVEIGIERMSEIQDEILWICEAAHTPAIWATQVLESLNKSGFASRSEATDAARSVMAECVMINKGTHIIEVIESLKNILERSGGHRIKKRYLFRTLAIAHRFLNSSFTLY